MNIKKKNDSQVQRFILKVRKASIGCIPKLKSNYCK